MSVTGRQVARFSGQQDVVGPLNNNAVGSAVYSSVVALGKEVELRDCVVAVNSALGATGPTVKFGIRQNGSVTDDDYFGSVTLAANAAVGTEVSLTGSTITPGVGWKPGNTVLAPGASVAVTVTLGNTAGEFTFAVSASERAARPGF